MSPQSVSEAVKAEKIIFPSQEYFAEEGLKYLVTDSRSAVYPAQTVFAALKTAVGDGHKYIGELYERGVRTFLVETLPDTPKFPEAVFVVVKSVAESLALLAKERLSGYDGGIVVTGSIGKTKFKELLFSTLAKEFKVRRSPASWNSSIGVPQAVWKMTDGEMPRYIITEAGIDAPSQGDFLRSIIGESHKTGVITPVTDEHDGEFASHTDKIREKLKIVEDCNLIIYADTDPELRRELEALGESRGDLRLVAVRQADEPTVYHALVKAFLAATGNERLYDPLIPLVDSRREIQKGIYGNTLISDYFTPDLQSLSAALDFMRRQSGGMNASVLILGPLLTVGEDVKTVYEKAFRIAADYGITKILCCSDECAGLEPDIPEGVEISISSFSDSRILDEYHAGNLLRDSRILLFGMSPQFSEALFGAGHDTVLEVNLDAIIHNYNLYRRKLPAGTGMVGMVKASAYGMGAVEVGRTLQSLGASYLAVAVVDEAIDLRNAGITMPIMVLNPVTNQSAALFAYSIEPAVFSIEELELLIETARREGVTDRPVHIKLDTGMHRVGFTESQLPALVERLRSQDSVRVASVFSHLATADCTDLDDYTRSQLESFYSMTRRIEEGLGYAFKRHILNTAGIMRFADCGPYEMARLGIGLYGVSPLGASENEGLKPVATFKSRIISLKTWPKGTPIGYGCRGITERECVIATIPAGYADGVNRFLGRGNASFTVKGIPCKTIGNICMDLCMIDVTDVPGVSVGDEVEIFGEETPVEVLAERLGTIPYELLTWVSPRVRRIYYRR